MEYNELLLADSNKIDFEYEAKKIIKAWSVEEREGRYIRLSADIWACRVMNETAPINKQRFQEVLSGYVDICKLMGIDAQPADPPADKQEPHQLQSDIAQLMPLFDMLENVGEIEIKGIGKRQLLDKSGSKWMFATNALCGYVANELMKMGIKDPYKRLSEVTGVTNTKLILAHSKNPYPSGFIEVSDVIEQYNKTKQKQK